MADTTYLTYYQRNRDLVLNKAKEYYKSNKDRLSKQAREKYNNLSKEEKDKKREYGKIDTIQCLKEKMKKKRI